ncbi:MAG TPA: hypothetical protein VK982_09890 [Bacteroidales bacterium]|jgi:hypothetical protein|nr:hypothetical protein [Bacteroidales bacterium]
MEYVILFLPVIIGIIIALFNNPEVDNKVDKFQDWLSYRRQRITPASGKLNRYITRPFLWLALKIKEWTNNILNPGVKSGLRVTLYIYLGGLFLYLFVTFAILIAIFIVIGIGFWIYGKLSSDGNSSTRISYGKGYYNSDEDVIDYVGVKGQNIFSGTNWLNEELKGRVDEDGNIYKGTNWLNEEKIGRIDKDGNIFKGTSFLSEEKVGRIDKDGNILKGNNWFTEEKSGRVDKDGNVYKGTSWFNEEKQGRSSK